MGRCNTTRPRPNIIASLVRLREKQKNNDFFTARRAGNPSSWINWVKSSDAIHFVACEKVIERTVLLMLFKQQTHARQSSVSRYVICVHPVGYNKQYYF